MFRIRFEIWDTSIWCTEKIKTYVSNLDLDKKRQFFFPKCVLAPQEITFYFLGTPKSCANESFFCWLKWELKKNKSLKHGKSEKLPFEISMCINFFKVGARVIGGFFSGNSQKVCKSEIFQIIKIRFEIQVSQAPNKWNSIVWNLVSGKKKLKIAVKKNTAGAIWSDLKKQSKDTPTLFLRVYKNRKSKKFSDIKKKLKILHKRTATSPPSPRRCCMLVPES